INRKSLIIFDEIQLLPKARQLIKYLVADGRYDYIEIGSLLSIKTNEQDIVVPSEEQRVAMHPLDFEEFLWAMGDTATVPAIQEFYEKRMPLGQALHRRVLNDFRQYMRVGGMPQAVLAYVRNKDFAGADQVKREILDLYRSDIGKFALAHAGRVARLFDEIPGQLSKRRRCIASLLWANRRGCAPMKMPFSGWLTPWWSMPASTRRIRTQALR
ncbi:MAG: AAA family ATPase, partial [Desulfovibrio sp.]|nr:AAA family ATPase [Desulfovibrio sp.]